MNRVLPFSGFAFAMCVFAGYAIGIWFVPSQYVSREFRTVMSLLMSAFALLSPLALMSKRRAAEPFRRWKAGQCFRCGYDLRSTRPRCPECGSKLPSSPSEMEGIIHDEQQAIADAIFRPNRWPAEVWLGICFFGPLCLTLWVCWRFSL